MALIQWDSSYSVNVGEIDRQHQKLVVMVNRLNQAMADGKGRDMVGSVINGLVAYAGEHFATEEKYFALYKYPGALIHKKEHADFVKSVGEFQDGFNKGSLSLTVEVMGFLKGWLVKHIQDSDKKYGPFLNEKGLR